MLGSPWRFAWACEPGTSHVRRGVVCQDHAEIAALPAFGPARALLAVAADGAGSAARADEGARAACLAFLNFGALAMNWLEHQGEYLDEAQGGAILHDVREDLAELASRSGQDLGAFACTMLGALVTDEAALFVQIGDGAIAYRSEAAPSWQLALLPQRGEYANQTMFVTRADAARHLQAVHLRARITELALMTDGVEHLAIRAADSAPHAPFLEHALRPLRACGEAGRAVAVETWLSGFLNSQGVNSRTDDDKTLALATRCEVTAGAVTGVAATTAA